MERLERIMDRLISSRLWVHVLFSLAFVFVFAISVLLSGNKDVASAAMLTCLFVLACTYVGRWCGKSWLSNGIHALFLKKFVSSVLIFSLLGAIGAGSLYKEDITGYFVQYLTI